MFRLQVTTASGFSRTLTFASAFERGLFVIALADQPVTVRLVESDTVNPRDVPKATTMNRLTLAVVLGLSILVTACGSNPMSATATPPPAAPAPTVLTYTINVPDFATTQQLLAQYPNGISLAPIAAQLAFDYTATYGGSNVYYANRAPQTGAYTNTGIVVAPASVANELTFTGAEWPEIAFGVPLTTQFTWLGRFVFTAPVQR